MLTLIILRACGGPDNYLLLENNANHNLEQRASEATFYFEEKSFSELSNENPEVEQFHQLVRSQTHVGPASELTASFSRDSSQQANPIYREAISKFFRQLQLCQENRVVLNVGGQAFTTSRHTLMAESGSFFSLLMRDDCPIRSYAGSHYNIDRDPAHFRIILNYLRVEPR